MTLKSFRLPQNAWFGDEAVDISLPSDWEIKVAEIPADRCIILAEPDVRGRLDNPIGSPALSKIAQKKNKAVIIFDDLSRPTKVDQIAPHVVQQILSGGIKEDKISFICALGAHGAHTRLDFEKKTGKKHCKPLSRL